MPAAGGRRDGMRMTLPAGAAEEQQKQEQKGKSEES